MVPIALMVSLFVAFIDRNNMGLALPKMKEEFGWTDAQMGEYGQWMLGAFFITYGLSNLFFSPMAARFGPRRSLMTIVVLFSVFTALGAPAAGLGMAAFIMTRVLLGASEGVHFPMMSMVTKRWFPVHERSRANGLWLSGAMLATILGPILLVPIIEATSWKTMLVVCGGLGALVTLPFIFFFVYDSPRESPRTSPREADYIESGLETDAPIAGGDWSFLKAPVFYIAIAGGLLNNVCVYGIINWLPSYFTEAKGLAFGDLWYAASLPYVTGVLAIAVSAYLGDRFNRRVLIAAGGFFVSATCVYLATRAPSIALVTAAFSIATFCQMAYASQEFAIIQRVLPERVIGRAVGVYNGSTMLLGGVPGAMLPGFILSVTDGNYDAAMFAIVGAAACGCVAMLVLSRYLKY